LRKNRNEICHPISHSKIKSNMDFIDLVSNTEQYNTIKPIISVDSNKFHCSICNKTILLTNKNRHLSSVSHKQKIKLQ